MKAILTNYRQSPRKVRLIANLVKGKAVDAALTELSFLVKRGALPIEKLVASAVANAMQNNGADRTNLIVKDITVNKGIVLKRSMPRAFGRASQILKRSSHVVVTLAEKTVTNKEAPVTAVSAPVKKTKTTTAKSTTKKTTVKSEKDTTKKVSSRKPKAVTAVAE